MTVAYHIFLALITAYEPAGGPITCTAFNRTGAILAYTVSYDWHKGHGGMTPGQPVKIMLHACKPEETEKKLKPK